MLNGLLDFSMQYFLTSWYGILIFAVVNVLLVLTLVAVTYKWVAKYLLDFLFGAVASIVTLPITIPVMIISAIDVYKKKTCASIFIRHDVVAKHGKEVTLHTFNTKTIDGEQTKLGAFLEKTGLKNLPVVYDLMTLKYSLVGVKPLSPLDEKFVSEEEYVHFSSPIGILNPLLIYEDKTGKEVTYDDMFLSDKRYAEKFGFLTDLKIVFTALLKLVRSDKSNVLGEVAEKSYTQALLSRGEISAEDIEEAKKELDETDFDDEEIEEVEEVEEVEE